MTISSETRKAGPYSGNGVVPQFPFNFKVFSSSDLVVVRTVLGVEEILNEGPGGYEVAIFDDDGVINFYTPPAIGHTITITSDVAALQPVDLTNQGGFYPGVLNNALDRLTILVQQLQEASSRSLAVPISSAVTPEAFIQTLLASADEAIAAADEIQQSLDDFTIPGAAALVGADDGLSGGAWTTVQGFINFIKSRLSDPAFYGAVGDGVTDDTVALQAALDAVGNTGGKYFLQLAAKRYRTTAPLVISKSLRLVGVGVSPHEGAHGTVGGGSWLYFDHTGIGIIVDGTTLSGGIVLDSFGIDRNQPLPAPAWTPTVCDFDILIENSDIEIKNLLMYKSTNGVRVQNGGYGRLDIDGLRGQVFQTMVNIDECYDVVRINDLHCWPFWRDDMLVHAYTMANLDAIYLLRCDNPMLSNVFSIFARAGIRLGQNAFGGTSHLCATNLDLERGLYTILVDGSVTNGATARFVNLLGQGETGLAGTGGIIVQGNNSIIDFVNTNISHCATNVVRVDGTGNDLSFNGATRFNNFNQSALGFSGVEVAALNTVSITGKQKVDGTVPFAGVGDIFVDEFRNWTPTIAAVAGTITTIGAVSARYKRVGTTVHFNANITITTNGTAASGITLTLPVASSRNSTAYGRETVVTGSQLQVLIPIGGLATVVTYNNAHPGGNGHILSLSGSYEA